MLSYLIKLKNKKGFTMVELIVVVAIIGILAAVLIPNLTSDGKVVKGRAYAKAFYYAVQNAMADIKTDGGMKIVGSAEPYAALGENEYFLIMAQVNAADNKLIHFNISAGTQAVLRGTGAYLTINSGEYRARLIAEIQKNMGNEADITGYYYAMVDSKYRVVAAYWSVSEYVDIKDDEHKCKYTGEDMVNDILVCSYPANRSQKGDYVFKDYKGS